MKIKPERTLMIAAHGWYINGAKLAGLKTAYITRYEKNLVIFIMNQISQETTQEKLLKNQNSNFSI